MTEEELENLTIEEWTELMNQSGRVNCAVNLGQDFDEQESGNEDFGTIDLFKD